MGPHMVMNVNLMELNSKMVIDRTERTPDVKLCASQQNSISDQEMSQDI